MRVKFSFIFSALSNFLENFISDDHQRHDQQHDFQPVELGWFFLTVCNCENRVIFNDINLL
jgi:hypothetical protein